MHKRGDLIVGISFFVLCLAVFISSFFLKTIVRIAIGPDFLPKLLSVLGMVISLALIFESLRKQRVCESQQTNKTDMVSGQSNDILNQEKTLESMNVVTSVDTDLGTATVGKTKLKPETLKVFALMIAYAIAVEPVGYLITTTSYLVLHFIVVSTSEQRKIPIFMLISIVFSVVTYFLFRNFFGVLLPKGILG